VNASKHPKPRPASHRCGYIPWHVLMRQLGIDVETCPRCGGKMKIIALVRDPQSIARYLRHLGLPTEEPSMAVPTGPRAYPPCPCPTRLRRARRLPADHRSGRAASCAAATASRPTRATPRRPRGRHAGCPPLTRPLAIRQRIGRRLP
jgi:hypothetical protein